MYIVFFENSIPKQVVSETVYKTGTNKRKTKILDVFLYSAPKNSIITSLKTIIRENNITIPAKTMQLTFSNFSFSTPSSCHLYAIGDHVVQKID